ncbi:MAG: tRNA (N6-threonylcarbamoyladenosine(37)-N6)-methyltransferase TrmO [Clostridiales bacterium]|nr:tRNA (N6-threonylcarbamoyladenosine(37)-N6)-methyltransferase TrmO [Clostridiales bacterium]
MRDTIALKVIARIKSDFTTKFGIPRQSGLVPEQESMIVFEREYRDRNALRGLEGYSHIWLIWGFSMVEKEGWSPMVKPPRLGGNKRMGVFATRSPFRPNPIGLSSVKLLRTETRPNLGTVLIVSGADLMDGTPIYDIKPYLTFTDSHPEAEDGFAGEKYAYSLEVEFPEEWLSMIPEEKREALKASLAQDPRPAYRDDPEERYGFEFAGFDVRFRVKEGVLTVCEAVPLTGSETTRQN